jgi:hypothetical protein
VSRLDVEARCQGVTLRQLCRGVASRCVSRHIEGPLRQGKGEKRRGCVEVSRLRRGHASSHASSLTTGRRGQGSACYNLIASQSVCHRPSPTPAPLSSPHVHNSIAETSHSHISVRAASGMQIDSGIRRSLRQVCCSVPPGLTPNRGGGSGEPGWLLHA